AAFVGNARAAEACASGARPAVHLRRVRADARHGTAHPDVVTGVLRRADDRIGTGAGAPSARVGQRARIPVVARGALGLRGVGAGAAPGIAGSGLMALVGWGANGGCTDAHVARVARVVRRARVAVVAPRARRTRDDVRLKTQREAGAIRGA